MDTHFRAAWKLSTKLKILTTNISGDLEDEVNLEIEDLIDETLNKENKLWAMKTFHHYEVVQDGVRTSPYGIHPGSESGIPKGL